MDKKPESRLQRIIEKIIFQSKWLLIPFYLGLIVSLILFFYVDIHELVSGILRVINPPTEVAGHAAPAGEAKDTAILFILELVDMAMIANLVKMIVTGSYHSFVTKNHGEDSEKLSSGQLKVKMATSLIGVSSINLLQKFLFVHDLSFDDMNKLLFLHGTFLVGALILAAIDFLHEKAEFVHEKIEMKTHKTEKAETKPDH